MRAVPLLAFTVMLAGCATLEHPTKAPHAAAPPERALVLSRLSAGMSMGEVGSLEPEPDSVITMQSQGVTVVKWIYSRDGRKVELYFTNGFLSSWQE